MATAATTLLGLALPVQGELSGTWGDTVNNSITNLLDSAVAGTTTLNTDTDLTLTTTTLAANQARQAILLCTGARTALRTITAPAQSKTYVVINATTGGFGVKLVGVGPTTGVTIAAGVTKVVAWNGSDFVATTLDAASITGQVAIANGGTNSSTSPTNGGIVYGTATAIGYSAAGTSGQVLISAGAAAPTWTTTLPIANGGTNATSAPAAMASLTGFTTTATAAGTTTLTNASSFYQLFTGTLTQTIVLPVTSTLALGWTFHICNNSTGNLTLNSSGGNLVITIPPGTTAMCTCILITGTTAASWEAGLTDFSTYTGTGNLVLSNSPTLVTPALGTPASGVVTNLTGTASININGTVGATTANSGAFTTLSSTSDATINGLTVGKGGGSGATNSALGVLALFTNSTGTYNLALGNYALYSNTANYNTAVGSTAMYTNSTGNYNTATGISSLYYNATGSFNTANGASALRNNTGSKNTALGHEALQANTTADNNTAVGFQASYTNQTGTNTTAIGYQALALNTANDNLAIGYQALYNNIGGNPNTAVGTSALYSNQTGSGNCALGYTALYSTTSGDKNVAIGSGALYGNTTGAENVAVGCDSYSATCTGSYNTSIGNTAHGYITTGSKNVAVGYSASNQITSGSNNVVIGGYTGLAAPISQTGSNWVVLSDGAGNVRQVIDSAGNAMFGTGNVLVYTPTPASISSGASPLTNANLQTQIINTTGTTYTLTLPTGTTLNTLVTWYTVDLGFDFSVINTASGTVTLGLNTGVTNLGSLAVATGTSARFRIRRTAASTYIVYRLS